MVGKDNRQYELMSPTTSVWHAVLMAEPKSADIAEGIDAIVVSSSGRRDAGGCNET